MFIVPCQEVWQNENLTGGKLYAELDDYKPGIWRQCQIADKLLV
jgi:hypothetical protein